jgi:hypothetical protein
MDLPSPDMERDTVEVVALEAVVDMVAEDMVVVVGMVAEGMVEVDLGVVEVLAEAVAVVVAVGEDLVVEAVAQLGPMPLRPRSVSVANRIFATSLNIRMLRTMLFGSRIL